MLDWVICAIVAITVGYVFLTWNYNYWKKQGIPYEKPQPLFGSYKDVVFLRKAVGTLMIEIYNKVKGLPYIGLFRFRTPALLICDPEIIKTILVKEYQSFGKNGLSVDPKLDPLFSKSPFFMVGEKWKHTRSLLSPAFTNGKLKPLFPLMEKAAKDMNIYLKEEAPKAGADGIEAKELCCKFTTEVVASCAFGIEAGCFKDTESEFRAMNKKMLNTDVLTNIRLLCTAFFPELSSLLRIRFVPLEVDKFYRGIVKEVMDYRKRNNETRKDFLQLLIQIRQKAQEVFEQKMRSGDELAYTDEDVTSHAMTFITEGFETSSITMSFLLYELAMNPGVQDKLREELEEALEKNDGNLTFDVITSLPYLHMVFTEALRMHPPVMTMEKFCTKPCEFPKENGGTLKVEPGTLILIPVHAIQYDPRYYPEPERFEPERFSEGRKDSIPNYTYLAFGEGKRICIGMRFAQTQIKIGVAHVVLNNIIRPSARTPKKIVQDVNYFLAASKDGLWLDFISRH